MTKELEAIFNSKDKNKFIIAMNEYICQKCQYGDDIRFLTIPERVFYITQQVEMEVNNGGFDQFFFNSSGDLSNEIVQAFTSIGAYSTAEICKKALSIFSGEVPVDRDIRQDILDELESDEFIEFLNECDTAFYEYKDDLNTLNYDYIMKNKSLFI